MVSQEREQAVHETAHETNTTAMEEQVALTDEASEMNEEDLDMDSLMEESMSSVENGQISVGHVVKVTEEDVTVDIGLKSEGVIALSEFMGDGKDPNVYVGMDVEVLVIKQEGKDGLPVLSRRRAKERAARRGIRKAYENGEAVQCYVKTILKGGFEVDVGGLRGFIPFSQMGPGARTQEDQKALVGQTIEAKILEMRNKRDLILSQRKAIEEKREMLRQETLNNLREGFWVKGVVKNLTDFGAFIDLGGIDGLLHVKDMSWDHVAHPRDMVKVGDEVKVMVLNIEGERISLGLKQKSPDPWLKIEEKYPAGSIIGGKVTSLTKYGAFVCLEEGVEGLIHVSEMSWTKRVKHPNELLNEGDEIRVKILGIDDERRRISLSLRQTAVDPWTLAKTNHPPGSVIEGEVTGMTDFGAFVRLPEGVDGMIHVSDLSWMDKAMHPKKLLKKGETVQAKVLEIDPSQQRISLGLKQLEPNPWDQAARKYKVGSVHEVEVKRITEFGAFVELEEGIEGLAHHTALVPKGQRHEDAIKVGEKYNMKVIKFDRDNQKISMSLREFQKEQEKQEVEQFMAAEAGGNATLGEMIGQAMAAKLKEQSESEEQASTPEVSHQEEAKVEPAVTEETASVEEQSESQERALEEAQSESQEPAAEEAQVESEEPAAGEAQAESQEPVEAQHEVSSDEPVTEEPSVSVEEPATESAAELETGEETKIQSDDSLTVSEEHPSESSAEMETDSSGSESEERENLESSEAEKVEQEHTI